MKNKITIRKDLAKWQEYRPVKSGESLALEQNRDIEGLAKLDANENLYGPSPLVIQRLSQFKGYQLYPDPEYNALRSELSVYTKVDKGNIFVSNGADEIIDLLLRLILNVGDEVLDSPPTFSSYALFTSLNRGIVKNVKRNDDYSLNIKSLIAAITDKTKIVFICNPNNPTGTITPIGEIEKIVKQGVLVCVDEAYIEFGGESAASLIKKYPNLIVIRSFSKWAGLAGLRLGYGMMSEYLVKGLMKIKPPYNVNYAAAIAGVAALQDTRYRKATIKAVVKERIKFEKAGFTTGGNFVFIRTTSTIQSQIVKACAAKKISVRSYMSGLVNGCVRITIGKPLQNREALTILKKYI